MRQSHLTVLHQESGGIRTCTAASSSSSSSGQRRVPNRTPPPGKAEAQSDRQRALNGGVLQSSVFSACHAQEGGRTHTDQGTVCHQV